MTELAFNITAQEVLRRESARDPITFMEYTFLNDQQEPLTMASIHLDLHGFLAKHNRGVVKLPRESGKTTNLIGRIAWEIGGNPNIRIKLVSSSDSIATARGKAVRELLESPLYKSIFPQIRIGHPWTDSKLAVRRLTISPDATLECFGVNSKATGGRCDLLILDDPDDAEVAISKAKRDANRQRVMNVWLNLLSPGGRAFILCTPWHKLDISHHLELAGWPVFARPVVDMKPVWPERWSRATLEAKKREIGSVAFARGWELVVISEETQIIKPHWFKYWDEESLPQIETLLIISDLAISEEEGADYTVILVLGIDGDLNMYVLELFRSRMGFTPTLKTIKAIAARCAEQYKTDPILGVESVNYQEAVAQKLREETEWVVKSLTAVKSKYARVSLASLHIEQGRVFLRGRQGVVHSTQAILFDEAIGFPTEGHDDTIDALAHGINYAVSKLMSNSKIDKMFDTEEAE